MRIRLRLFSPNSRRFDYGRQITFKYLPATATPEYAFMLATKAYFGHRIRIRIKRYHYSGTLQQGSAYWIDPYWRRFTITLKSHRDMSGSIHFASDH
ncbi:hypothetical protein BGX34_003772, partial [Mortierella sp. NVP85]